MSWSFLLFVAQAAAGIRPPDGGPVYAETDLSRTIVEPFNFASSACFFLVVGYWFWQLRGRYRRHGLLTLINTLLFIGCVGGTIYHGFRLHRVWLVMDWMPILINLVLGAVFFWKQVTNRWSIGVLAVLAFLAGSTVLMRTLFEHYRSLAINLNYGMLGLMLLVPLTLTLWRTRWRDGGLVLLGLLLYGVAIFFRYADGWQPPLLPMGTHFLWHLFGILATTSIMVYLYRYVERQAAPNRQPHANATLREAA